MKIESLPQPHAISIKEKGPDNLRLEEEYVFVFVDNREKLTVRIPAGFKYDGASVPRWAWSVVGFERRGVHDPASLIHDFLYEGKGRIAANRTKVYTYDRKFADQLFEKAMDFVGVRSWHTRLAYLAVRAFGGSYWKS